MRLLGVAFRNLLRARRRNGLAGGTMALGTAALILGVLIGGAMVLYWANVGIRVNTVTLAWLAGGDFLYPRLEALSVLRAAFAIILMSTLAAIYPAYSASRLEPREALHRF